MPRYFFNIHHQGEHRDSSGMELLNAEAAWKEATTAAGEIIKDLDGKLKPGEDWRMEVTDEFRQPIWEISIKARKM